MEGGSVSSLRIKEKREVFVEKKELPCEYGETRIFLIPRDPFWMFTYWELTPETKAKYQEMRKQGGTLILRVYDVTGVEFDGTNANSFFDITINESVDNWYINVPQVNRNWCVDIGVKLPDGSFIHFTRSNVVFMPRYGVSPITDEKWAILQTEFERLLKFSGVDQIGKGSFDVAKLMRERWEEIVSISSLAVASPMGVASWRGVEVSEERKPGFWLKVDTELIVYGQTEPTATVRVGATPVGLCPDGSFSLRFYLPEGETEIPISAENSQRTQSRHIKFNISRKTS